MPNSAAALVIFPLLRAMAVWTTCFSIVCRASLRVAIVGVFSETDLARFERQRPEYLLSVGDISEIENISGESYPHIGMHVETICNDQVGDWMTPEVISVDVSLSLEGICHILAKNRIHRVFVMQDKRLLGVVSSMDVVATIASLKTFASEKN